MAPGRKVANRPSTRSQPQEYERARMQNMMLNNWKFRSLGLGPLTSFLNVTRSKRTFPNREDSGSQYEPEDEEDIEEGVVHKETMMDLEHELSKSLPENVSTTAGPTGKSIQEQDQPARVTRQRTRELASDQEDHPVPTLDPAHGSTERHVPTSDPEHGSTEDAHIPSNDQNELSNGGQSINKRHVGRGLYRISKGVSSKIQVHIAEGNLRPEVPLQAAKLASEAGIILRNHVPIYTHWKHYKKDGDALVQNYVGKIGSQFTIDTTTEPVKAACTDLLKKGQRQMRYKLKKQYFDGIPANQVRTTSPLPTMTDMQWKELVDMWSTPKHKEKCLKNKDSREQVQYHQATGSRSYVSQCYVTKQEKYKDAPPSAIDIFKDTHCSSKSGFSENVQDAIAQMEAIIAQPTQEGQDPKTPIQAVAQVLPKSTFLRNVGLQSAAMKRNAKAAAMNERVHELESELHAEKAGAAELRAQMGNLQKQVEDQNDAARKHAEETEKLRKQVSEIQGFLRSLFGSKFASSDAE